MLRKKSIRCLGADFDPTTKTLPYRSTPGALICTTLGSNGALRRYLGFNAWLGCSQGRPRNDLARLPPNASEDDTTDQKMETFALHPRIRSHGVVVCVRGTPHARSSRCDE